MYERLSGDAFDAPVSTRAMVVDAGAILAVAGVLAGIYYLVPVETQRALALNHRDPAIYAFWTHALVHQPRPGDGHLLGNLAGYVLVAVPAWLLCLLRGQRRRFRIGMAALLVAGPPVVAAVGFVVFDGVLGVSPRFDRGFSGIVGAIAGFLLVVAFEYVDEELPPADGYQVLILVLILFFGGIGVTHAGLTRLVFLGFAGLGFLAYAVGVTAGRVSTLDSLRRWIEAEPVAGVLVVGSLYLSLTVFVGSFPSTWVTADGVVNVFGHAAGLMFGMIVGSLPRGRTRR